MRIAPFLIAAVGTIAIAGLAAGRGDQSTRGGAITVVRGAPTEAAAPSGRDVAPARATLVAAPARAMAARSTLWKPGVADTWQWQISGRINPDYDVTVYDVDLFDAPDATLDLLRARGRRIICYFSAGSSENWRKNFRQFAESDMGKPLDGWAGERWLDTRSQNVRRIMRQRLSLAAERGCDGVEPDNVDGYANKNGVGLSAGDQLDYNQFLATEAHRRGLAIGLKNDLGQVRALVTSFDYAVNEQCNQYRECDRLAPFTAAGKPVFNAEYAAKYRENTGGARVALCSASRAANIRTLVLPLGLDDKFRISCD